MMTTNLTDQRAWTASTIDACENWYYSLSDAALTALKEDVVASAKVNGDFTRIEASATVRRACAAVLAPVAQALESGRGFAIIDGVPEASTAPEMAQRYYWLIGQLLGRPIEQNIQGTLVYDVRDTGQYVSQGARFSVTNAESTFHTDNSFGEQFCDYVGLLCIRDAKTGGVNQLVSAYTIHNEMLRTRPDLLEVLYRPLHVDRRGGVREGESSTIDFPVFQVDGRRLTCRYLRYWIEVGHQKRNEPLTPLQIEALNLLDSLCHRADFLVQFRLRSGQIFIANNRWTLHNRTAFEDHSEPQLRRHLVRLWLKSKNEALVLSP